MTTFACAVVSGIFLFGITSPVAFMVFGLLGAIIAATVVFGLSALSGSSPLTLVLAGTGLTAMLTAVTSSIVLVETNSLDQWRFWSVGSTAGRGLDVFWASLPFIAVGLALALIGALTLIGAVGVYAALGALIHLRSLPSIVVTLGMSFVWQGLAILLLPKPGGSAPDWLLQLMGLKPPWIPFPILAAVLIAARAFQGEERARRRELRRAVMSQAKREVEDQEEAELVRLETLVGGSSGGYITEFRFTVRNQSNETPAFKVRIGYEPWGVDELIKHKLEAAKARAGSEAGES